MFSRENGISFYEISGSGQVRIVQVSKRFIRPGLPEKQREGCLKKAHSWVAVMADSQGSSSKSKRAEREFQSFMCLIKWRDIAVGR